MFNHSAMPLVFFIYIVLTVIVLSKAHEYLVVAVYSVSNDSGPSLGVRVWVGTKPAPNWRSGASIDPN